MLGIKKVVLFDFDGVLVDTFAASFGIYQAFNPGLDAERYRSFFDGNIYDMEGNVDWVRDEEWWPLYIEHVMKLEPVPGIGNTVQTFSERYPLFIVSSSLSVPIDDYLRAHGLASYFSRTMGADVHKSKAEKFRMLFEHFGEGTRYVFITDTLGDLREAEKVGVQGIGVTWGFHPRARLEPGNPWAIVGTPKELEEKVMEFFNKE